MAALPSFDYSKFSAIDIDLENFIKELSKEMLSPDDIIKMSKRLAEIYERGYPCEYRHSYSGFFAIISGMADASKKATQNNEATECLTTNLVAVRDYIVYEYVAFSEITNKTSSPSDTNLVSKRTENESKGQKNRANPKKTEYVKKSVLKLTDHILIETARYWSVSEHISQRREIIDLNYRVDSIHREMVNTSEEISIATKRLDSSNEELKEATKRASSLQNDLISVLGIFSAIALTTTAGITFTTSTIESLHNVANPYRLYLTICFIGFILFNLVYGLMFCIDKLTGKDVLHPFGKRKESIEKAKEEDCSQEEKGDTLSSNPKKQISLYSFVNIVFLITAVLIISAWVFDLETLVDKFNDFESTKEITTNSDVVSNSEIIIDFEQTSNADADQSHT